jgi:predicted transglutaminase-like cysteine proteinase
MAATGNLGFAQASLSATPSSQTARLPLSSQDFLASRRVSIGHTSFDGAWDRVRQAGLPRGVGRDLLAAAQATPGKAMLAAVNSWANARIRYVEDRELYGQADFWASASETLRRRAGDCEDIAIAKMQVLAAMGVPRDAMYLTLARDLVRGSDHAVLVVRLEDRNWLLDNATDQLLDASQSYDYRPIMSFSAGNKWLHGY